jgi:hypothetical protein
LLHTIKNATFSGIIISINVKEKVTLEQATKAQRGVEG